MQRADRRVRVPGAARAVLREHLGQPVDVVGEMLERHRAVLDERHRLAVALHAHHDVEAGLAHVPQRLLRARLRSSRTTAAGQAEVAHQLGEARRARRAASSASSPVNSTSRIASGSPIERRVDHRAERRDWRARGRSSCGRPARPPTARASRCAARTPSRGRSVGKLTTPSALCARQRRERERESRATTRACLRCRPAGARG